MRREDSRWIQRGYTKEWWKALDKGQRQSFLTALSNDDIDSFFYDWRVWARDDQLAPDWDWDTWLMLAGRGWGKTRTAVEFILEKVNTAPYPLRIAIVGQGEDDVRNVMVEGQSGFIESAPPWNRPKFYPSKGGGVLVWPNGCQAFIYSIADTEALRGPQFHFGWCFVAGTMVATPGGGKPIETLTVGDVVLTRKGPRPVLANSVRQTFVGEVRFDNGARLIGTADHPVYLSDGWMKLGQLSIGDVACAINASSGTASAGIATATGISSAARSRAESAGDSIFIAKCGSPPAASRPQGMTSITRTTIAATMRSIISSACRTAHTWLCTRLSAACLGWIGVEWSQNPSRAWAAASACNGDASRQTPSVRVANRETLKPIARGPSESALGAEPRSNRAPETFAVSVASTWRPAGVRSVYCLKVEGEPEYFANGILVHNCDEPMAAPRVQRERALDNLEFCLRLGEHPQLLITTTPKPDLWLRAMEREARDRVNKIAITRGTTYDNQDNLAANFIRKITRRYSGTKKGRQEIEGLILGDEDGALWTEDAITGCRVEAADRHEFAATCDKVVVSVDPNTKNTAPSGRASKARKIAHAAGIVVCGKKGPKRYVLADCSTKGGPNKWVPAVVDAVIEFDADEIVVEINQGGDMVKMLIRQELVERGMSAHIHTNFAKKSKEGRAEPVARMYERGEVLHVGPAADYEKLEMQMVYLHEEDDPTGEDFDRCDAMVWGITRLGLKKKASSGNTSVSGGIRTMGDFRHGATAQGGFGRYPAPGGDSEF